MVGRISFSVCPHDTEKGIGVWKDFSERLQSLIGMDINFEVLSGHDEESKRIEEGKFFDLYYASPTVALKLYRSGYVPVAKFKGQKDQFFLVVNNNLPEDDFIMVSTPFLGPAAYPLLNLEIERVKIVLTSNFLSAFELLKEGKVHACLMYNETWEQIEDKGNFLVLQDYFFDSSHFFMVKPEFYTTVRAALLSMEEIEEAHEEHVKSIQKVLTEVEKLTRLWSKAGFFFALNKARHVGALLYTDKILYINQSLAKLLDYSVHELQGMDTYEALEKVIPHDYKSQLTDTVKRRLRGEGFDNIYFEFPLVKKDGSLLWTLASSETVLYEGSYAGLVLFVDITRQRRLKVLYELLMGVNKQIFKVESEEELFRELSDFLTSVLGLKLVWIGVHDPRNSTIVPIYVSGQASNYTEGLFISTLENLPEGQGPTAKAFRENKIYINEDSTRNPMMKPWAERQKAYGIKSSCAIPIAKDGKVKYVLNLYAGEPYFFTEENQEVLYELKESVEFMLEKIQKNRDHFLISQALENSKSWVMITDKSGRIIYVNHAVSEISGYSKEELIGKKPSIFKSGYHPKEFYESLWKSLLSGESFYALFVNKSKSGNVFYLENSIFPVSLPDGTIVYFSIGKDITREIDLSSQLERLTFYDILTNLMNIEGLRLRAEEILKKGKIGFFALIDLCNFSLMNRLYGEKIGDRILVEVGNRLQEFAKDSGLVARLASDEFAILMNINQEKDAIILLQELEDVVEKPVSIEGLTVNLTVNVGVSLYPFDGNTFGELHEKASIALMNAKKAGEGESRFFESGFEQRIMSQNIAMSLVQKAVNEDLFIFFYQPYWESKSLKLHGFEALVRIRENGKVYSPIHFIDYLENSKYLRSFEGILLRSAKSFYDKHRMPLSINISARSFKSAEFIETLIDQLSNTEITVEITERLLMEDVDKVIEHINKIRSAGIRVAIDDFGTGYSSLSYLSKIPVDLLKIDMSFVKQMVTDRRIRVIVENMIRLANGLDIETLAEGVETKEQLSLLQDMGCTYVQGYLLAKPMPEEELKDLIYVI